MVKIHNFFTNIEALAILDGFQKEGLVPPNEFAVGAAMAHYMGDKDVCWPTREEISKRTGIRRIPTISAAITRLVKIGFIERERTQRGVRYRLCHGGGRSPDVTPDDTAEATHSEPFRCNEFDTPENPDGTTSVTSEKSRRNEFDTSDGTTSVTPYTLLKTRNKTLYPAPSSSVQSDTPGRSLPKRQATSKPSKKTKAKMQYPGDLNSDAEKLVDLYAELVKPKRDDASGSRKTFLGTAKRLLSEGKPLSDLERAIQNYAAARLDKERRERDPEAARKYRFGFQSFFGPKNEHWRDYLGDSPGKQNSVPVSTTSSQPEHLDFWSDRVKDKLGMEWALRFREKALELGDTEKARTWLAEEHRKGGDCA